MSIITPNLHGMQTDETLDTHQHQLKCDLSPAHGHTVYFFFSRTCVVKCMFDVIECNCRYVPVSKHSRRLVKNQENMLKLLTFLCIKKSLYIGNIFSNKI